MCATIAVNGPRRSSSRTPSASGSLASPVASVTQQPPNRRARSAARSARRCTCSASAEKSAIVASVPFQPNGLTTRSASIPAGRTRRASSAPTQHAEVDALRRQPRFARSSAVAAGRGTDEHVALPLQVARHLPRQRLHDARRDERRRIARITRARTLAVALQERVVGLGTGPVRTSDPVARRTRDRLRPAEASTVHAAERPVRVPMQRRHCRGRRRSPYCARTRGSPRSAICARQSSPRAMRSGSSAAFIVRRKKPGSAAASRRRSS